MNKNKHKSKYLFVDLDGSLINTDLLFESFWSYFGKNNFATIRCAFILIVHGLEALKTFLYKNSLIDVRNLPYNQKVLDFIASWKRDNGGEVILISASENNFVNEISNYLNIFDDAYGTELKNLKGEEKLLKIKAISKDQKFDYIGNSRDDLVIWQQSFNQIIVNPKYWLKKKAQKHFLSNIFINERPSLARSLFRLIRIHQWSKNSLLFLPFLLGLAFSIDNFAALSIGFISFSLLASSFYIFNDLLDTQNDRLHQTKKFRPIASGELSFKLITVTFFVLFFTSFYLSMYLNLYFQSVLVVYGISNYLYSKHLKRIPVIDILALTFMYVVRIIAGAVIIMAPVSNWLITFSAFFFLFLSAAKRLIEIKKLPESNSKARGYLKTDERFISNIVYFSSLISILILCLYINSQQVLLTYSRSNVLWAIPFILFYWVVDTLFKLERGQVHDDPVTYALKNKNSYLSFILFCLVLFLAN